MKISKWYLAHFFGICFVFLGLIRNLVSGVSHFGRDIAFSGLPHVVQNVLLAIVIICGVGYIMYKRSSSTVNDLAVGFAVVYGGLFFATFVSYVVYLMQ